MASPIASTSRLSLNSIDSSSTTNSNKTTTNGNHDRSSKNNNIAGYKPGQYSISTLITDPKAPASFIPSLSSFSNNSYLTSLGTTFTPSSLPLPSTSSSSSTNPNGVSVAQRRSQAPQIIVSETRKVEKKEFETYLKEIEFEWDRWERERRLGREGRADLGVSVSGSSNGSNDRRGSSRGIGLGIGGSSTDFEGEEDDEDESYYKSTRRTREEEQLPSLNGVPKIYFDSEFNLANPRTFDLVTERIKLSSTNGLDLVETEGGGDEANDDSENTPTMNNNASTFRTEEGKGPANLTDLATDQILQEKLSHYTAVIESHLVKEIGIRSSSFFSALTNLQSLHSQGEECLIKIEELQQALTSAPSTSSITTSTSTTTTTTTSQSITSGGGIGSSTKRALEILRLQARRRGLEKLEEGIQTIEEIWKILEGIKDLVEQGEWRLALEVGENLEERYFGLEVDENEEEEENGGGKEMERDGRLNDVQEEEEEEEEEEEQTFETQLSTTPTTPATKVKKSIRKKLNLNLTKIKSLDSIPIKLNLLRLQISSSLELELVSLLNNELEVDFAEFKELNKSGNLKGKGKEILNSTSSVSVGMQGGEGGNEAEVRNRVRERVRPVIKNLVRANGIEAAITSWRESVLKEVRAMVREHLPTNETQTIEEEESFNQQTTNRASTATEISEKSLTLAKNLRALTQIEFLSLAKETYSSLLSCIEIVDLQASVLIELISISKEEERIRKSSRRRRKVNSNGNGDSKSNLTLDTSLSPRISISPMIDSVVSNGEDSNFTSEISEVVHATAELANLRFSKVLGVRTELHSSLDLSEFIEIFNSTWNFILNSEIISQRMIIGLRGVIINQAKSFLQTYHQKRLSQSAKLVENEQWGAAEVNFKTQKIVNLILQSAVKDPIEFLISSNGKKLNGTTSLSNDEELVVSEEEVAIANTKQLDIEGREYFAVSAGLISVELLADYLKVVMNCPLLTTDAVSKVVEYMKSFNSRTCQVVLGAGAMRSAGLKNITAKHLALASQALSIMISLIPYIRETLRRHLNPKQAVMLTEFDKLKRDYQEHQNEIHAKLVAIMGDRLGLHCKTLQTIDWEVLTPGRKEGQPNVYMEALVKEHTTLHKVLSRFLQAPTVEFIMMQVFSALNAGLAEQFSHLEVKTKEAKGRMMVDVSYLKTKLAELKGMERETPGAELENLISMKQVPEPPRPVAPVRTPSFSIPFSTTSSPSLTPIPTPAQSSTNLTSNATSSEMESRPSTPLPAIPIEEPELEKSNIEPQTATNSAATVIPTIEVAPASLPAAIATPPKPIPVPRKSMAERLAEVARRGSGDFPKVRTPSPSSIPSAPAINPTSKLNEVVELNVKNSELPSVPIEVEEKAKVVEEKVKGVENVLVEEKGNQVVEEPEEIEVKKEELEVVDQPEVKIEEVKGEEVKEEDVKKGEKISESIETPTIPVSTPDEVTTSIPKVEPVEEKVDQLLEEVEAEKSVVEEEPEVEEEEGVFV